MSDLKDQRGDLGILKLRIKRPRSGSGSNTLPAVCHSLCILTELSLSFLICKMGIVLLALVFLNLGENQVRK